MDIPQTHDPGQRRRLIVFVVGSLLAVVGLALFVYLKDAPLEYHRDLEPKSLRTESGELAYAAWVVALAKADDSAWDFGGDMDAVSAFYDSLYGKRPWDAEAVEKILTANRDALDAAIRADALGDFSLPEMKSFQDNPVDFSGFQHLSKTLQVLAIERAQAGDFEAARDAALVNQRLADRLVANTGSLIGYLVATTCQAVSYSAIERVADLGASDGILEEFMENLEVEGDLAAAFQQGMRVEFHLLGDALANTHRPTKALFGESDSPSRLLLQRNRTLNETAEFCRDAIADAEVLPARRSVAPPPPPDSLWSKVSPNAFGKYVIATNVRFNGTILGRGDHVTANRRALLVKLALLRYELAEGRLPASLAELVPVYLDAVPADPFDGNPLRYDAARGLVWVLGKNLTDEGAATEPENGFSRHDDDPALFLHPL